MQQERQAAIDRQNQVILSQLMKIKQSPARVDNWNKRWKPRFLLQIDGWPVVAYWTSDWLSDWPTTDQATEYPMTIHTADLTSWPSN